MDQGNIRRLAPQSWIEAIARGEADVSAGRVSDLEPFLSELEAEDAADLESAEKTRRRRKPTARM
jgi:hypothetical protein